MDSNKYSHPWTQDQALTDRLLKLVDADDDHLDSVWQGHRCTKCKRNALCGDRISK